MCNIFSAACCVQCSQASQASEDLMMSLANSLCILLYRFFALLRSALLISVPFRRDWPQPPRWESLRDGNGWEADERFFGLLCLGIPLRRQLTLHCVGAKAFRPRLLAAVPSLSQTATKPTAQSMASKALGYNLPGPGLPPPRGVAYHLPNLYNQLYGRTWPRLVQPTHPEPKHELDLVPL